MTVDAFPDREVRRQGDGDRRAGECGHAQRAGARAISQRRSQAVARHVRQCRGHDRRAGGCAHPVAHRHRLQPLWRQYFCREARARRRPARRRRRRPSPRKISSSSGASFASATRAATASRSWRASRRASASSPPARSSSRTIRPSSSTRRGRCRCPRSRPNSDRADMNRFTDLFIKRPVLATVVSLLILLIGGMAALKLQVRQFPAMSNTTITITTTYPGANADLIKGFITTPIEQAVASTEGIDTLVSTSQQNVSTITLNLRLDANPDRAVADVLAKTNQVRGVLPRDANDPIVVKQTGQGYALMYLSFNSAVMTASQITDYLTRVVQPRLQTIDGVANAQILGGQTFAMRIWLDPTRMAALGVTPADVRDALAANNFTTAAGEIKSNYTQVSVNALTSLEQRRGVRAARRRDPRRCADPARRDLEDRARAGKRGLLVGVRRPEGGVHRHLRDARGQSADRDRQRQGRFPGYPEPVAGRPEIDDRLQFHRVHPRFALRGHQDPRRGDGHRHPRHFPFPRQSALDDHSHRHDSAFARRRDDRAAGARLFHQPSDAFGAGARHRPRRRRRDRRRREHPPAHRGRHDAVRRGDPGRARDRAARDRDDDHAGRGLCPDRVRLGRHRRAVSRIRVHARRLGHRLGLHRADAFADDVLEAASPSERSRAGSGASSIAPSRG